MYTMLDVRATTQSPLICSSVVKTHEWNVFQRKIFYGYFAIGKAFIIWLNKNIDCWWWSGPACTTRTWPTSRCTRPTRTFWTSSQGHTHTHTLQPFYQCSAVDGPGSNPGPLCYLEDKAFNNYKQIKLLLTV